MPSGRRKSVFFTALAVLFAAVVAVQCSVSDKPSNGRRSLPSGTVTVDTNRAHVTDCKNVLPLGAPIPGLRSNKRNRIAARYSANFSDGRVDVSFGNFYRAPDSTWVYAIEAKPNQLAIDVGKNIQAAGPKVHKALADVHGPGLASYLKGIVSAYPNIGLTRCAGG